MSMPGFYAESSLGPTLGIYRRKAVFGRFPSEGSGGVMPQLRFQSDREMQGEWRGRSHMPFLWRASSLHNRWPSLLIGVLGIALYTSIKSL